jgi:hypothetical protein
VDWKLFGSRFRAEVLPIGLYSVLGFGFSTLLAWATKSQSNMVLTPNAARLAESSATLGSIFSGVHDLSSLFEVALTAIFAIGSLVGMIVFFYRTIRLAWTVRMAK